MYIRLGSAPGQASALTVKVPDKDSAAGMIATLNGRAATRAALRARAAAMPRGQLAST